MPKLRIFIRKNAKKAINLILDKSFKCDYPAPELCPNYDELRECCCNLNSKCSYHNKPNYMIINRLKNIIKNKLFNNRLTANLIFPEININSDIPEIFKYKRYTRKNNHDKKQNK